MLDEVRCKKNVQNLRLATWLTEVEYEGFASDWESQQQITEELNDKPDELKRYQDKLKKAIFQYSIAEGYSAKGKHSTAEKFYNSRESLCEEALEILQELLHVDASIQQWFDKALDFDADGDLGLTPVAMPRVNDTRHSNSVSYTHLTLPTTD